MKNRFFLYIRKMRGGEKPPQKKLFSKMTWSWLGAFIGVYCIAIVNELMHTEHNDSMLLLGSFGASAVLIYAAPYADFSQPRNFLGGHFISTMIGISVYKFLPFDISILGAIAVSFAIVVMYYTNTMHPPGGATALAAVVGSEQMHELGYMFAFSPVLLDSFILFIIALVINNLSDNPKRHYPRYWF
ncbi:MAG: HPP family protein [Sulfurimonadaceae bacterium]|jgi:CBS domain-containing membrane protein|nr:HPP family protein [Sulfurimonadaceae bacterium]